MKDSYFASVLAEIGERATRAELIRKADDRCQGKTKFGQTCGWLAFTVARQRQLSLRPKLAILGATAEGHWVLCPKCTDAYDAKKRRKAG